MVLIDAVILAGGQGRRMGGADKGLLQCAGYSLVQWALQGAAKQTTGQIFISANRNLTEYAAFGYPVLSDVMPNLPGPMAGIHAALLASNAAFLLVMPCDVPVIPNDLVLRLSAALNANEQAAAAVANDGQAQWTICLLRANENARDSLNQALSQDQNRMGQWLVSLGVINVPFATGSFPNLNTPEDLAQLAQQFAHSASGNNNALLNQSDPTP